MATDKPAVDWPAVRADYEAGLERGTVAETAVKHHTTVRTLQNHARAGGWVRRRVGRTVNRGTIIIRMFRVLERQVAHLEEDSMKRTGETEVAVLGKLASTLEKLIDIDKAESPEKPAPRRKDMAELREKLAQRIAQLKDI